MTRFAVIRKRGAAWSLDRPKREQEKWKEHADFMDRLADEGFIVLGGPLGDGSRVLLVIEAENEEEIQTRLDADPWTSMGLLFIASVDRWEILLGNRS